MKPLGLILGVFFVFLYCGCQQNPNPMSPEEELLMHEENPATEEPQTKSMVHAHKAETENTGEVFDHWLKESKSDSAESRKAAATALGDMGPAAIPVLNELLHDKDLGVRLKASSALKQIKDGQK